MSTHDNLDPEFEDRLATRLLDVLIPAKRRRLAMSRQRPRPSPPRRSQPTELHTDMRGWRNWQTR